MDYEKKVPEWGAPGTEPPDELKAKGFEAGYKPPADYFNWFWHTVGQCLAEIRTLLKQHAEDKNNPHNMSAADINAAAADHTHSYNEGIPAEGDGETYTASVSFIKALEAGVSFTMVPNVVSTTTTPKLNVNGLGEKNIRRRLSSGTASTTAGGSASWLAANKPIRMEYDGTYWIADIPQANANDLYGVLPIAKGGHGAATAEAARENLGITPANIGAAEAEHTHTLESIGAAASDHTHTPASIGAATADHTHTPESIGAAAADHTHTPANIGAAPAYDCGTEDLTAGESALETGKLYFVYE